MVRAKRATTGFTIARWFPTAAAVAERIHAVGYLIRDPAGVDDNPRNDFPVVARFARTTGYPTSLLRRRVSDAGQGYRSRSRRSEDFDAAAGAAFDLGGIVVDEGGDLEAVVVESAVVGQGDAEVAGAGDEDAAGAIEVMPFVFVIPGPLRDLAGGRSEVRVDGSARSVSEALSLLGNEYPKVHDRIVTELGEVRPHINIFIDGDSFRDTGGLGAPIRNGAEILILPAVSGG